MRNWTTSLHNLFGLRVYGDSLLFPIVRTTMTAICIFLLIQGGVDLFAWSRTFLFALPGMPVVIPLALGAMFMAGILIVDRFLVVADTSGSRTQMYPLFGRAGFLFFLAMLTAIPFELSVFKGEIDRRIEHQEKLAVDEIRQKALDLETAKFDGLIIKAEKSGDTTVNADQKKLDTDIQRFQADADKRHQELATALKDKSAEVAKEAAGAGLSHHLGRGPAYLALQSQEADLRKALNDHDAATQTHLDELRKQRDGAVDGGRQKGEADVNKVQADKDAKLDEVRNMDPNLLADKYQGDWKIADGFLERFRQLSQMMDEDIVVTVVVWGCRSLMIVFGLALLLLKLFAPLQFRRYYSVGAQAAAGNEEALKVLAGMGHSADLNSKNLGLTPEVLDLHNAWSVAYFKFLTAVLSARKAVSSMVKMSDKGLYPERHILDRDMRTEWVDKVLPAFETLQNVELRMSLRAAPIPSWPSNAPITDPRGIQDPWLWSDDQLRELGWVNPDEAIIHGREALGVLEDLYRELRELTNGEFTSTLIDLVQGHPTEKRGFFTDRMFTFYRVEILPFMNRLEAAEGMVRHGGLEVPPLPADLPSRNTLHTLWRVDEKDLRQYGWTGPTPVVQRRPMPVARPPRPSSRTLTHRQPSNTRRPGDTLEIELPVIPPPAAADLPTSTTDDDGILIEEETDADRRAADAAAEPLNGTAAAAHSIHPPQPSGNPTHEGVPTN